MPDNKGTAVERVVPWLVLIGGSLFAVAFVYGAVFSMFYDGNLYQAALQNIPVTLGLPCAALSALCLVLFLKTTDGAIELKVLGFEFKGASGPIVMWVLAFLAMILAIKVLWRWPTA